MNPSYSIMGVIGKFTPLNTSSFNAAIEYHTNLSDNFSSSDMNNMNTSAIRSAGALGLASGFIKKATGYVNQDAVKNNIYSKLPKSKGKYLFVVTVGLRNSDNAPTRIVDVSRVYTATPESKARFMRVVDSKCSMGEIPCASIPAPTNEMHNIRIYIIASIM